MRAAAVKEIKNELNHFDKQELIGLCLRLSKFKKENKELLTYLLFESKDEEAFIKSIKIEMDEAFGTINTKNFYYAKKTIRKILRELKKHIRYSQKKETEVELLLYFCGKLINFRPSITRNTPLFKLYKGQMELLSRKIETLHEDLQYDYRLELEAITKK